MLVDHMLVSRQKEEGSSVDVQVQDGHLGDIICLKLAIYMVIMVM